LTPEMGSPTMPSANDDIPAADAVVASVEPATTAYAVVAPVDPATAYAVVAPMDSATTAYAVVAPVDPARRPPVIPATTTAYAAVAPTAPAPDPAYATVAPVDPATAAAYAAMAPLGTAAYAMASPVDPASYVVAPDMPVGVATPMPTTITYAHSTVVATDVTDNGADPQNPVVNQAPQGLTVEEVIAQAVAEGVMLHVARTNTGYKGVYRRISKAAKGQGATVSYQAQLKVDRKVRTIGNFPSPAEAALAYSCTLRDLDLAGLRKKHGRPRGRVNKDGRPRGRVNKDEVLGEATHTHAGPSL